MKKLSMIENARHLGDRLVWCQFDWSKAFTALDRGLVEHVAKLINIPQELINNMSAMQRGVTAMLSVHKEAQPTLEEIQVTSGYLHCRDFLAVVYSYVWEPYLYSTKSTRNQKAGLEGFEREFQTQ